MVGSVFGIIFGGFSQSNTKYKYNGHTFKVVGNKLVTKINGNDINVYYLPETIIKLNISEDIKSKIRSSQAFFLTYSPTDENVQYMELLRFELAELEASQVTGKYFLPGMTKESTEYSFPIIDCQNATDFQPVIVFKTGNSSQVTMNNNCITFNTVYSQDVLLYRDWLVFQVTGIAAE